jgi:hypothetical protein
MIILVMLFVPQGIVGWIVERGWFRRRRQTPAPEAPEPRATASV